MAPPFIPLDPCWSPDKLKSLFILGNWQRTGAEGSGRGQGEEDGGVKEKRGSVSGEGYPGKNASMESVAGPGFL